MTEPLQGVVKTGGVERRKTMQERQRHSYSLLSHHDEHEEILTDDTVEISDEARKRADGTYHKNILEHLEDED
jgi:hypothetical protein